MKKVAANDMTSAATWHTGARQNRIIRLFQRDRFLSVLVIVNQQNVIAEEAVILKEPRLHSGIPRHVLESFARCLLPDIRAFYASKEGRREFAEWKKKQQEQQEQKENGPDEAR